jgi:hypothetical protein
MRASVRDAARRVVIERWAHVSIVPRRAQDSWRGLVVATVLAAATTMAAPGVAGAQQCPEKNPTYTDACGPTFVVPSWGDAGGWTNGSKSSTIQLADFNGDGRDELIGRNDQGLEIFWFDTDLGEWRPQVDANGVQQVLTDFRSPLPNEKPATDWTKSEYYSTIQTAHINGNPNAQVLARFADGMHVYVFNPGPGGSINGGSWALISQGGPFSDADGWDDPSRYLTIHTGDFDVSDPGKTELIGRGQSGLVGYKWNGSGWSPLPVKTGGGETAYPDDGCGQSPSCYTLFRMARLGSPTGRQAVIGRTGAGVNVESYSSAAGGSWSLQPGSANRSARAADQMFSEFFARPDCPFAGGSSIDDCLGSSPTYYDTFGVADIDGDGVDEILARGADGLRVKKLNVAAGTWTALPTLTDLAGDANLGELFVGQWASIRTADLDGDHKDEVLALEGAALQVWSYDPPSRSWQRWQPSTALALSWAGPSDLPYIETIRTGDVDGDGHDDVIARGPYGIRTWFYNRRGTGGWERYLAGGYASFPGASTIPGADTGQAAAFDALNKRYPSGDIRGVWTGETLPDTTTLQTLQTNLAGPLLGNCDPNSQTQLAPPTYGSCTPPSGSTAFSAGDWKAVVNELLAESYFAEQVLEHFGDLETIRKDVFASEQGSLPAIAGDLQLAGGAGNTTNFNLNGTFAAAAGIGASIAGAFPGGAVVSAALWVASELFSALPSASPTATSTFQTNYDGLLDKVATAQDEMAKALGSERQQVLSDQGLLGLVGQLRSQGTWKPDTDGMISASRQAFALTTYQALLPTMFPRYAVTNCTTQQYSTGTLTCDLPTGPYAITSGRNSDGNPLNGTWVGPQLSQDPCGPFGYYDTKCDYGQTPGTIPDSVGKIVWGPVADTCDYQPHNLNTVWIFGCSLGVPVATSIGADSPGWTFPTQTGNPIVHYGGVSAVRRTVRASAARATSSARAARAAANARAVRDRLEPLRFTGRLPLSRALRLRRMRVVVDRTLFEHGRREELAGSGSGRPLRPFSLRHVTGGLFTFNGRGGPRVRLQLRRIGASGGARLDLRLTGVRTHDIRVLCGRLPARVSLDGRPLELETRLRLRDGAARDAITLRQRWRCVRDRKGEFTGIRPIDPKRPAARPGLAVRMQPPHVLASERRAIVFVTVANQRRARPSRVVSSLWDLRITGSAGGPLRSIRVKELRARRSRTLRLVVPVPAGAGGRVCVQVAVNATSARDASTRRCVRIAGPPRFTG